MRPTLQPLQPTHAKTRNALGADLTHCVRVGLAIAALLVIAAFAALASPTNAPATPLADKQARAAELDRQVSKLELQYDELQERYRGALHDLDAVQDDVEVARQEVAATRRDRTVARTRLRGRAIAIYQAGGNASQLVDVAATGGFADFFEKLETVRRVGDQDSSVLDQVEDLNVRVERKERALTASLAKHASAVRRVTRQKAKMSSLLDERQAMLGSVNADIRQIMEAQRRAAEAAAAKQAREAAAAARVDATATGGASAPAGDSGASSSDSGGGGISVPLPPASGSAGGAVGAAMSKIGSPYVWAASGPDTFDCSGLVVWAFAQAGRPGLPHSTYSLVGMGVEVPMDQLQPGDLVFGYGDGHVGIYVGGGNMVHAPHSGDVVKVASISSMSHARRI